MDLKALFNIGYGLYVVTCNDGQKHNGLIVNTVMQITNTPNRVAVAINKQNYSHDVIKNTKKLNVNCINTSAKFSTFKNFGFKSGKDTNKFESVEHWVSKNGLAVLTDNINSYMSLEVETYIDIDTHGLFICTISDAAVINDLPTMTYDFYTNNVKPKPQTNVKVGYVCKICGYVYEGDPLPDDFVCPLCKHGAQDFEKINIK